MSCQDWKRIHDGDSFQYTRHPLITHKWYIILISNELQSQFTHHPKDIINGWRVNFVYNRHTLNNIQRFWWWVGDECFKMNHRCKQLTICKLQRYGWRVAEFRKNSFFQVKNSFAHSSFAYPSLCLRSRSVVSPFQVRCKSVLEL